MRSASSRGGSRLPAIYADVLDTLMTSPGTKRWAMLAPSTDVTALGLDPTSTGPAGWFIDHLPRLRALAAAGEVDLQECVQRAGEMVYIPHGWHHAILNLELSTCVAHTTIMPDELPLLWPELRARHPSIALPLHDVLLAVKPSLARDLTVWSVGSTDEARMIRGLQQPEDFQDEHCKPVQLTWAQVPMVGSPLPLSSGSGSSGGGGGGVSSGSGVNIIVVLESWLDRLLEQRPDPSALLGPGVSQKAAVGALQVFHQHLLAVAAAVRSNDAVLCLGREAPKCDTDPAAAATATATATTTAEARKLRLKVLAQHGLTVKEVVHVDDAEPWRSFQGLGAARYVREIAIFSSKL